jgi:hypothetical protein
MRRIRLSTAFIVVASVAWLVALAQYVTQNPRGRALFAYSVMATPDGDFLPSHRVDPSR